MLPISIAGSIVTCAAGDGVAGADRAHVDLAEREVAPRDDAAQVRVGAVGAGDVAAFADRAARARRRVGAGGHGGAVEQDLHASVEADRPDEAGRAEPRGDLLRTRAGRLRSPSTPASLISLTRWSPRKSTSSMRPSLSDHDRIGLQQRTLGYLERAGDLGDGREAGRRDLLRGGRRRRQLDRLRVGAGDLDVGGVLAGARAGERDLVLAGGTRRHVLVCAGAAHHADVGLDAVPAQAGAFHDAVVGADVQLVALVEAGGVAVEGVGVLHDELARAQHPGARARLVALLDLEVVEDQRQVAVGAHGLRDVRGDGLLVGHREHELGALAVLQLEELLDRVAPGLAPRLGGLQHGHQQLLPADRVHLLADDSHDALVHAPAGGQPAPHAGADLADQPGADHQLVRDRLGVGGGLLLGGQQVLGEAGHLRVARLMRVEEPVSGG